MVSIADHSIVSPYGIGSELSFQQIKEGNSAVQLNSNSTLSPTPTYLAKIENSLFSKIKVSHHTRLESMMIRAIEDAVSKSRVDLKSEKTLLILSTTKGNIDLLEDHDYKGFNKSRSYLGALSKHIGDYFKTSNTPLVVSNACISGGCALELGSDFLQTKRYNNIVVCGGDVITEFVISGFRSFHALSEGPCAPYDKDRDGINLGEAAACVVLSSNSNSNIQLIGSATSNDSNHISGPSRTGEGLYLATLNALNQAQIDAGELDYISAHGTATNYNDEMESIAFGRAFINETPLNSYKGYIGHTLGAAGVIETILTIICLQKNVLIKSLGYMNEGTSQPLNVIETTHSSELKYALKTGSGFGGGNNALIFRKN